MIARISELTSVVSQLIAERDQARASASSSYRGRRSRSDIPGFKMTWSIKVPKGVSIW